MNDGGTAPPGWYADPWFTGQHRYWTGTTWTADVFPDGPTGSTATPISLRPSGDRPPVPPPTDRSPTPPPAPTFGYAATAPTTAFTPWEFLESAPERPPRKLSHRHINAIALVTGLVVGFVVVAVVLSGRNHHSDPAAATPNPPLPSVFPSAPVVPTPTPSPSSSAPVSSDPGASVLPGLVVRQGDVPAASTVQLLDGGNLVDGQTTLDLCNGTFPSEGLRTARLQVVEYAADGTAVLSTEAVLYRTPANAAQAMSELRSVVKNCPDSPVVSPVGEDTVTTQFGPAPDHHWPAVSGVERQAYSFTTTGAFGIADDRIAVYLHRGRVLEGLYFNAPDGAQPAVDGQTTIAGIVHVFEQRIAALPRSVTGG